ncbi:hypothetical protein ACEU59_04035 [Buttiauxella noackiae]|uniref:hypothetical protein n=1 Tax=Buttiauxella noackiae TaxID=82992 RepID=UPI0035A57ED0
MKDQTNSVENLYALANLEGELLVVAAYERMDIGTHPDPDDGNFTTNQWQVAWLAQTFVWGCRGDLSRYAHLSCKVLFDEVIELARRVCPEAWDYFVELSLRDMTAMAAMD